MTIATDLQRGILAGAAGTAALNVVTNLDMAVRGRASSNVPAQTAQRLADEAGADLAPRGDDQTAQNRSQGLGALLGYVTGIGIGAVYGVVRPRTAEVPVPVAGVALGLAAMAGSDVPATTLDVTDPREWGVSAWVSDIIPHLLYGVVTAAAYEAISPR